MTNNQPTVGEEESNEFGGYNDAIQDTKQNLKQAGFPAERRIVWQ